MKLELKHLAPYLPYSLKIKTKYGWATMITLNEWNVNGDCEDSYSYEDHPNEVLEFKPILRPLSDLNKAWYSEENEEDEEGFEQVNLLGKTLKYFNYKTYKPRFNPYFEFELLIKNYFDVFGLIEKGLAIDINTL